MTPRTSPLSTTTAIPAVGDKAQLMQAWRLRGRYRPSAPWVYWTWCAAVVVLDLAVAALGAWLIGFAESPPPLPTDRRITVPFAGSAALEPLRRFEGKGPVAVVTSRLLVSSYAAFALAWALGNIALGVMVASPARHDLARSLTGFACRAMQLGVVLLAGMCLRGCWAVESLGLFWGWGSKEAWALAALLCYAIPLVAQRVGWLRDFGLAVCAVICFASLVIPWYGVNYVLGARLHSYGFGGGNNLWVCWGVLLNVALVAHAGLRYWRQQADEFGKLIQD